MLSRRTVWSMAALLIVAQLVIRAWLAFSGSFYWDDLVLIGRASSHPILSWTFLGHDQDGHFMPAAFLVAGLSTVIAPVNWVVPAITLIVLQAIASMSVWRMIRVVAGRAAGPAVLAVLAFYLFTPMTVPAFAWWAAALNSLPLQAAMAWIVSDVILLVRTRGRHPRARLLTIRCAVVFLVSLAFFEKSLFILPVAVVAAVIVARGRTPGAFRRAFAAAPRLWMALAGMFVVWTILFFSITQATAGRHSLSQTVGLVWRSVNKAIIPSLVGGPWSWDRWVPSPPMGSPSAWAIVGGWAAAAALAGWALTTRRGTAPVLIATAGYAVLAQIPAMWNRSSDDTAQELAQTMRYLPDTAVVITLAVALILAAARRSRPATSPAENKRQVLAVAGVLVAALTVASALISSASFARSWHNDPTADYLANAKRSLAQNHNLTMLDQALPLEVLLPIAYPYNQISRVFGRVDDRPRFATVTTDRLIVLDPSGYPVPGGVTHARSVRPGPGTCARPEITGSSPVRRQLDGPLLQWQWIVSLAYCANVAGAADISLDGGTPVRVPVQPGLHTVYLRLDGRGDGLRVRPLTRGLSMHTGDGRFGDLVEARLAG